MKEENLTVFHLFLQAARELVLEVIREKDGDFRSGRSDFGVRLGGTSLDVRPVANALPAAHQFSLR